MYVKKKLNKKNISYKITIFHNQIKDRTFYFQNILIEIRFFAVLQMHTGYSYITDCFLHMTCSHLMTLQNQTIKEEHQLGKARH